MTDAQESRAVCPITRTSKRFLLRSIEFSQQYAPMYRCRMEAQQAQGMHSIQHAVKMEFPGVTPTTCRVLELAAGVPSVCVGVVYKQMKLLPSFLAEYQKELVRVDAGDDDGEEGGGMEDVIDNDREEMTAPDGTGAADTAALAATDEHYSLCTDGDEVLLEDSSGRVVLQGVNANLFCTGVIVGVFGTLEANGKMHVQRTCLCGLRHGYVPRPLTAPPNVEPCYVAFVCGLNVNLVEADKPESIRARTFLGLLVDFICGNVTDPGMLEKSRRISRLVIGGNSIAPTEELKLKKKVKLDPSDHAKMSGNDKGSTTITSAMLMRELDEVLAQLAASVEVELLPGDNDMSDAFQPQQPLHPVLLPTASRYSTLRLVTNPFEFSAATSATATAAPGEDQGTRFFVSSGQGINDMARETKFPTRLGALSMVAHSGCACPTAPNTLFSYPFREDDPFVFPRSPHCFVACDQPCFETRYATLDELDAGEAALVTDGTGNDNSTPAAIPEDEEATGKEQAVTPGVRLVCVPSFERTGALVLVDVRSPSLASSVLYFKMK